MAFIPWAQQRYKLRSGIWYDAPHEKVLIQYNTIAGTILIKAESGQNLVCNPYRTDKNNYGSHFFLDATKDKIYSTETDESWKENLPTDVEVELVDDALFGNYIVSDVEGNNYSIIAPIHHLANEPDNKTLIPSYTRYAWTTNVTGIDIYTCYSEYVYSQGEPFFRGTYAPPESEFQSALIVGLGVDGADNIHVAQLIEAGNGSGYWMIKDKDGASLGVLFGSESSADSKAKAVEGSFSNIWKNETATRWWVEFHSTNCLSLNEHGLMPASLNISRRESSPRAGGVKQWFYDNGTNSWGQFSTSIEVPFISDGLDKTGALRRTLYSFGGSINSAIDVQNNTILIALNHTALSRSGNIGGTEQADIPIRTGYSLLETESSLASLSSTINVTHETGNGYLVITYGLSAIPCTTKSGTPNPLACIASTSTQAALTDCPFIACDGDGVGGTSCTYHDFSDATCANGWYSNGLGYLEYYQIQTSFTGEYNGCGAGISGWNLYGGVQTLLAYYRDSFYCQSRIAANYSCVSWNFIKTGQQNIDDRFLSDSYLALIGVEKCENGYLNKVTRVETWGCIS